ncbi:MAG: Gfo/Idh/MocA family oxidoreductase [Candidatus Latescibacteria bacterium]|nr:Gfo/Idh/MocA family oxidoreductase [Candidatus Latescibacterota bacterium]
MEKRYRAGVIGRTGRGNYGHGLDRVYLEMEDVELVAVADDDPAGLEEAGKRLGVSKLYLDYREMLEKERFDIVSVCPRWVAPHYEMVLGVAATGACIFLEKPMARTLREADAMLEACEKAGVTMGVAHQGRMHGAVHYGKRLLQERAIGTVLSAQIRGKEDKRGGGEDLMVLGTHMFDTLRFLLGANPEWVFASVTMDDGRPVTKADAVDGPEEMGLIAGDRVHALYGFPQGVTVTFESRRNQSDAGGRFGLQILGTEGIMAVYQGSQQVRIYGAPFWRPDLTAPVRDVTAEALGTPPAEERQTLKDLQMAANVAIVRDVLLAREEGRQPINSGYDGRWALEMIHGVYAAHLQGKRAALPLVNRDHPLT